MMELLLCHNPLRDAAGGGNLIAALTQAFSLGKSYRQGVFRLQLGGRDRSMEACSVQGGRACKP